ncbi:MAG: hypothetical protein K0U72_01680 [Gammaproteobacteria bacterium]|nr:hypothetical protein [Gammaproteobacteria bacterium]
MTSKETELFADESAEMSADLLDAYVQGKLPPEQQAQFETYIMDKPDLLEQAELGLLMQEGFKVNETSSVAPKSHAEPRWRLAAAAAIVSLGVGSMLGYSVGGDPSGQSGSANGLLTSQIINLSITRSESPREINVVVSDDIDVVVLRVPLPDPESRLYALSVSSDAGPVGTVTRVRPDGGGVLTVALDAADLKAGNYSIAVDDGDEITPLSLKVSRDP